MEKDEILAGGINVAARICHNFSRFPEHLHYEVEVLYCVAGRFAVSAGGKVYTAEAGDALAMGSLMAHEIIEATPDSVMLAIEIGPLLLREYFAKLASVPIENCLLSRENGDGEILSLLSSVAERCGQKERYQPLELASDVFKLSAMLIEKYGKSEKISRGALSIEKTLTYICENYSCNISVEEAAKIAGYAPTSFCRVFKKITGMGFHEYLNHFRVRTARYVLLNTDLSIETVAVQVGYPDAKTFCRVFRNLAGVTPMHYRKRNATKT